MSNGRNILIVEDDQSNRELMQCFLQNLGYRVETTDRPEKALSILQSDRRRFDLAYIDIHYEGTDVTGFDLVRQISNRGQEAIPFFIMSMSDTTINRAEAIKLGAIDFLDKTYEDLVGSIEMFTHS